MPHNEWGVYACKTVDTRHFSGPGYKATTVKALYYNIVGVSVSKQYIAALNHR